MQQSPGVEIWVFKSYWMKAQVDDAITVDLGIRGYRDHLSAESLDALRLAYRQKGPRGYWAKLRELVLPKFRNQSHRLVSPSRDQHLFRRQGRALRWLEKAFYERANWTFYLKVEPTLDPLRSDPRFGALLHRMGVAP
jgi:hypothetical protein